MRMAEAEGAPPLPAVLCVRKGGCEDFAWDVENRGPWLSMRKEADIITVNKGVNYQELGE